MISKELEEVIERLYHDTKEKRYELVGLEQLLLGLLQHSSKVAETLDACGVDTALLAVQLQESISENTPLLPARPCGSGAVARTWEKVEGGWRARKSAGECGREADWMGPERPRGAEEVGMEFGMRPVDGSPPSMGRGCPRVVRVTAAALAVRRPIAPGMRAATRAQCRGQAPYRHSQH